MAYYAIGDPYVIIYKARFIQVSDESLGRDETDICKPSHCKINTPFRNEYKQLKKYLKETLSMIVFLVK